MIVFVCVIAALAAFLLLIRGRKGHPGLQDFEGWYYAHRGLHGEGRPENSMAAFRASLEAGYGIEFDLHLLKDGSLAVIHDSKLKRTTGAEGRIEDLTAADLPNYRLEGTEEIIPTFRQLLDLYAGKAPLIVELKPVDGNHAALCKAACDMLDSYDGPYCLESFDPRCIRWLRKNRPELIRGQLAENTLHAFTEVPWILRFCLTYQLLNCWTLPDFIAYKYHDRKTLPNFCCRKIWNLAAVSWTIKTKEDFDIALAEGWLPIFEGFRP